MFPGTKVVHLLFIVAMLAAALCGTLVPVTLAGDNTTANPLPELLQFRAGGHVLGFAPDQVYLAGLDHALRVEFLDSTPENRPIVSGAAPNNEQIGAPTLSRVTYPDLWPGISLTYEGVVGGIAKSTYHLAPGADVARIQLRYSAPVEVGSDGSLSFRSPSGRGWLAESPPLAWQEIGDQRTPVQVDFTLAADNQVGFRVSGYDPRYPLTIDPTYQWHTFYGSSSSDSGYSIAVDGSGNVYIAGTSGATWQGEGGASPLHPHSGSYDMVVVKLDSSGAYRWHTFYGSDDLDWGSGIAVDGSGNVYVTGDSYWTWQGDGSADPLHAYSGGRDLVVVKLNSSGAYQWHTFYGSSSNQYGRDVSVDNSSNIYVTGYSEGTWQGSGGASPLHTHSGGTDLAVLKLNNNGAYQWHTFYGSGLYDYGYGGAVDGSGNVYVAGTSEAIWQGDGGADPLHAYSGLNDIVVMKLNSGGSYQWHTFYGASNNDWGYDIAVDGSGGVYVTGDSYYPWLGDGGASPIHARSGGRDLVALKLNSSGGYQWHTFYGSSNDDYGRGIAVDNSGNVYVAGYSNATWLGDGGAGPLHAYTASDDLAVVKLNSIGTYQWHTFYGSGSNDWGYGVTVDGSGNVYVTGVGGAWLGDGGTGPLHAHSGSDDMVVVKLADRRRLSVAKDGAGSGTVSSDPMGIACGVTCSTEFDYRTVVTLTATADTGAAFTGWSGACSDLGDCVIIMDAAKAVTATFSLNSYALTVNKNGSGGGTVSSQPAGIDCGADCSEVYSYGTVVTLTATADIGSAFATWGGVCSGVDECVVTIETAKTVTATFTLNTYALAVSKSGTGSGAVSSTPAGVDCGGICSADFVHGTMVTLIAVADTGSTFSGWAGVCSGADDCVVNMDAAKAATATFSLNSYTLTVSKGGTGSGAVSSDPVGIDCGTDCSEAYSYGTVVTLTTEADTSSVFAGWSGACGGSDPACQVVMIEPRQATATFVCYRIYLPLLLRD